jgi:hypothetical protein
MKKERTPYTVDLLLNWVYVYMAGTKKDKEDVEKMSAAYVKKGFVTSWQAAQAKEYGYSDWAEGYAGGLTGYSIADFIKDVGKSADDCIEELG